MNVLVTGAASGIGRATCLRIARDAADHGERARIAAADIRRSPELASLVSELEQLGAEVLPLACDLGAVGDAEDAVSSAVERFGGLDGLVSCAGINRAQSLMTCSVEDWDRIFAVNTRATWLLAKAAHGALRDSCGSIVAVSSISGTNPHAGLAGYGPSKAALIMLIKVLAQELAPDGIRVNCVSPGMTRTGMTRNVMADPDIVAAREAIVPLGRVADPDDIAAAIGFLLSSAAGYVNGHDLVVDGGLTGTLMGALPGISMISAT